ncbi:MAG: FAD-binding protein [Clostridiaceae bacterium]|jgi:flavin-dependent dehydrogenase|nr:FAD-binding protein [Clostridiaceae bacterium]
MNSKYDVLVVGSGTAGIYFARNMAEQGYKVLVIDAATEEKLGNRLNIFHTDKERFASYGVPEPKPGDEDYVTEFDYGTYYSPSSKYVKRADYPFTVALLPPFLRRMRKWAKDSGVEFLYEAAFQNFIYGDDGRINGAEVLIDGEVVKIGARLVADCSGIPAVARRKLKKGVKVEDFEVSPRDKFYVVLRYVRLKNPERDKVVRAEHWAYYKGWMAPSETPDTIVLGTGANLSYEYAETCFERFAAAVKFPEHEFIRTERGVTPYRRAPYSLVADGFVCLGDAACMTKSYTGEGITSGWVGCRIAAEVAGVAMKNGAYPTESALWNINVKYNSTQAADFAYIMATLINAVECTADEMEYEFKKDIVFTTKALTRMNRRFNAEMPLDEIIGLVFKVLGGVLTGKISMASVKNLLRGIMYAGKLKSHYKKFPQNPDKFDAWKKKADILWENTGSMADVTESIEAKIKEKEAKI